MLKYWYIDEEISGVSIIGIIFSGNPRSIDSSSKQISFNFKK